MPSPIRHATREDLAIVDIYNQSVPTRLATADTVPVSVESREPWFNQHSPETYPLWVYEIDGEIAGWASLSAFHYRPAFRKTAEVSTYLANQYQGQGIGSALTEHLLAESSKVGINTLVASIFGHNAANIALYAKFGFEHWGRLPEIAEMDGLLYDVVFMGRRVDSV